MHRVVSGKRQGRPGKMVGAWFMNDLWDAEAVLGDATGKPAEYRDRAGVFRAGFEGPEAAFLAGG